MGAEVEESITSDASGDVLVAPVAGSVCGSSPEHAHAETISADSALRHGE
jgi:hypothetical protein